MTATKLPDEPNYLRLRNEFDVESDGTNVPTYGQYVMREDYDALRQVASTALEESKGLREEVERLNGERDGSFMDGTGCCKLCDGEIPYGHLDNCDLWKAEAESSRRYYECVQANQRADQAESRVEELRKLLRKVRDGSADLRVCCGNPIEGGGGSFDHPPDPPQCCGEPEMLHDLIDDALAAPPASQPT